MDKYVILEQVGAGTFGAVYKAQCKKTNEIVALKKMYQQKDEEGMSYFALQEIKYLKLLVSTPNIISLIDCFLEEEKAPCLVVVLPYYDSDLVGAQAAFSGIREIKCALKQILTGLSNMHARKIMHRDIKPANMLMRNGEIVIADMGMTTTCTCSGSPLPSQVVTLWYRSPELLFGAQHYGTEVDIWSCGILFIELMTRKSPFPGQTEHHQTELILDIMGRSYLEESEDIYSLPLYAQRMTKKEIPKKSQLRNVFSSFPADALDLLTKMLCPAHKRHTAQQLLEHPFFTNHPLACLPEEIPAVQPLHELQLKQRHQLSSYSRAQSASTRSREDGNVYPPSKRQCTQGSRQGRGGRASTTRHVPAVPEEKKSNW